MCSPSSDTENIKIIKLKPLISLDETENLILSASEEVRLDISDCPFSIVELTRLAQIQNVKGFKCTKQYIEYLFSKELSTNFIVEESTNSKQNSIYGTIRSGSIVKVNGDLIIYGDVNPGAQVIASGNILALGVLKGLAHAGRNSFIIGFDLQPTQIRIGKQIAIPSEDHEKRGLPEIAFIRNNEIVIERFNGRLPRECKEHL